MRCCSYLEGVAVMTKCLPLIFLFALEALASASDSETSLQSIDVLPRYRNYPGWSKRSFDGHDDIYDGLDESSQELIKKAPGWGKRSLKIDDDEVADDEFDQEKRAPGWGKRAPGWGKRAPGWGKRAPGWGKRAPGWGKRAPGWGKRSPGLDKRAPGWGKRAPGWGKRAPGWGKRMPGWGKRSASDLSDKSKYCGSLEGKIDEYIYKAVELDFRRLQDCGKDNGVMATSQPNEPLFE